MKYSVVRKSDIDDYCFRIDAEYYDPRFLESENIIRSKSWTYLIDVVESIRSFGAYSLCNEVEYIDEGVPFLRCKDIYAGYIDFNDVLHISEDSNKLLWKSEVSPETVLLAMSGSIGNVAVATSDLEYPINSNQDIAKIRLSKMNPYILTAFFNGKFGQELLKRTPVGSVQQHIFIWQLEKMIIPIFTHAFGNIIENIFSKFIELKKESKGAFERSKLLILDELGLADYNPKHTLTYTKNSSEVQASERFDAEYFQPKYEEIVEAIKKTCDFNFLSDITECTKGIEVGSGEYQDEGVPFIRVSNLSSAELTEEKYISQELYTSLKKHQPKKDEILFSKDASPGIAYHVAEVPDKMIVSGGILRLSITNKKISPEYLLTVLNSITTQSQMQRDVGGSIIKHWRPEQIRDVIIPVIDEGKRNEITGLVIESRKLLSQSKQLIDIAKRAVEMAIEQDEEKAIHWIEEQVNSLE